jgi:cytoskeletal protein CcmA (bactofilin family)
VKKALAAGALLLAVLALASPAWAQDDADEDELVVLNGRTLVPADTTFEHVVVFHGPVTIEGTVSDSVVVFDGSLDVTGEVGQDVVMFNGPITIRSGASVGGDVISRSEPVIEDGATVDGELRGTEEFFRDPFPFLGRLAAWLAVSISVLILGLLFLTFAPRAADAIELAARTALGPSVGWGLIMLIGLPILAIVAFITLVGIPFGVGLGLALFMIYAFGYTMSAWILGRRFVTEPRSRFVAFLVGLLILRGLALIPIVAGIVGFLAAVVGLGAIVVAIWRARRAGQVSTTPSPAPAV